MSVLFKSVIATLIYSLYLLILTSNGAILVTSPFFILSALNTSKEKYSGFILIFFSLISYSSIFIYIYMDITSAFNYNSFLFLS